MLLVLSSLDQGNLGWSSEALQSLSLASICDVFPFRLCGRPVVIWLLSWGQKSAVNCAQSSYSGGVTNWSRQCGGIGDLLSSPGIICKRYTDWSHNKLTNPPAPPPPSNPPRRHVYTPSLKPLCGEEAAARKGSLLILGLFSFGELRYCARVSRDDSSGQMN